MTPIAPHPKRPFRNSYKLKILTRKISKINIGRYRCTIKAVEHLDNLRGQFRQKFKDKVVLAGDPTGSDVLVGQTFRKKDVAFEKLTVSDYYFKSAQTDGKTVLNGYIKLHIVGRGAQGKWFLNSNSLKLIIK